MCQARVRSRTLPSADGIVKRCKNKCVTPAGLCRQPLVADVGPYSSQEFRVIFKPNAANRFYHTTLECYVAFKTMRSFRLVNERQAGFEGSMQRLNTRMHDGIGGVFLRKAVLPPPSTSHDKHFTFFCTEDAVFSTKGFDAFSANLQNDRPTNLTAVGIRQF